VQLLAVTPVTLQHCGRSQVWRSAAATCCQKGLPNPRSSRREQLVELQQQQQQQQWQLARPVAQPGPKHLTSFASLFQFASRSVSFL
jgi:hypothetical protein